MRRLEAQQECGSALVNAVGSMHAPQPGAQLARPDTAETDATVTPSTPFRTGGGPSRWLAVEV